MKSFNLLTACLMITGVLGLSACVLAGPGPGARQAQARDDHDNGRHDDGDRRCDSGDHRDGCQDREHQ
jgi:hypothetical protein